MIPLLRGVRLLEVSTVVMGPLAGQILADLGADVVKLEPIEGDVARSAQPALGDLSALYANNNRNKRVIAADLKSGCGRGIAHRLIAQSDVLLINMRPDAAERLGLDTLVEVHDASDLATARSVGAQIVGINNRDLHSLDVDLATSLRLRPLVPAQVTVVAESGIATRQDVRDLEQAGVDAILVGEALMRVNDPAATAAELLGRR